VVARSAGSGRIGIVAAGRGLLTQFRGVTTSAQAPCGAAGLYAQFGHDGQERSQRQRLAHSLDRRRGKPVVGAVTEDDREDRPTSPRTFSENILGKLVEKQITGVALSAAEAKWVAELPEQVLARLATRGLLTAWRSSTPQAAIDPYFNERLASTRVAVVTVQGGPSGAAPFGRQLRARGPLGEVTERDAER